FSANAKDRSYFLGQDPDSPAAPMRTMGGRTPCIRGSDAHETAKSLHPDHNRYGWIQADPTFEGLRQLLHEPEARGLVGPTPPAPVDQSKIIKAVRFKGDNDWFATTEIPLNSGLVGMIGEKGSGKTAFAELVAFAASKWAGEKSSSSFIRKAGK